MMPANDILLVLRFWGALFFVGSIAYPLTKVLFGQGGYRELDPRWSLPRTLMRGEDDNKKAGRATRSPDIYRGGVWFDDGYFFSKAVGMATVTFGVFVLGSLKILPFGIVSIAISMGIVFLIGLIGNLLNTEENEKRKVKNVLFRIHDSAFSIQSIRDWVKKILLIVFEESIFLGLLVFWAWIKGHESSIHGLEKFMDFGFTKSILNGGFFPPKDIWYSGLFINYYYFGHLTLAVLTKLSGLDLAVTFNLILATLFSLCFTMAGSIGAQLAISNTQYPISKSRKALGIHRLKTGIRSVGAWVLTGFFVTLAGNMQTIYAFTRGYTGDNVKPFWELFFPLRISFHSSFAGQVGEIWTNLLQGLNTYWYANATRFIPFTIHEFPSYSFVVSDIHGHVLSIPFALLAIALLIHMSLRGSRLLAGDVAISNTRSPRRQNGLAMTNLIFYGFLCGVLFMTNALDGPIYLGLFFILLVISRGKGEVFSIKRKVFTGILCVISAGITALPFILTFKPFVTGIGVNCPPAFLANHKIGPFLFETIDKCQHSPLWMWWLLWGFFVFAGGWWIISRIKHQVLRGKEKKYFFDWSQSEMVLVVFFFVSLGLLIFPEFLYFKDIYPAHFRSNTMFKFGYQAFMMLSIVSVYGIISLLSFPRKRESSIIKKNENWIPDRVGDDTVGNKDDKRNGIWKIVFFLLLLPQIFLVSIFPLFSVRSYFNSLRTYESLDGMGWMRRQYPDDAKAIDFINDQSPISNNQKNILVEADGDSYTDYARMSAFTGMPTVIGWPVHEWLWRGSYDVVAPRRADVARIYETTNSEEARILLEKYHVTHVIVGTLERQKYPKMYETKFESLGSIIYTSGETRVYRLNP